MARPGALWSLSSARRRIFISAREGSQKFCGLGVAAASDNEGSGTELAESGLGNCSTPACYRAGESARERTLLEAAMWDGS
jgi:hypothetical protein